MVSWVGEEKLVVKPNWMGRGGQRPGGAVEGSGGIGGEGITARAPSPSIPPIPAAAVCSLVPGAGVIVIPLGEDALADVVVLVAWPSSGASRPSPPPRACTSVPGATIVVALLEEALIGAHVVVLVDDEQQRPVATVAYLGDGRGGQRAAVIVPRGRARRAGWRCVRRRRGGAVRLTGTSSTDAAAVPLLLDLLP